MSEIICTLDREWATYDHRREVRAFMTQFAAHPLLDFPTAAALAEAIRVIGRTDPERADLMLGELMRLAPREPVAQRIVLQALLPGLCNVIRRLILTHEPVERETVGVEVISLMGLRIASHSIERRPRAIAFNVLRDVERDYRKGRIKRAADATRFTPELDRARETDPTAQDAFDIIELRIDLRGAVRSARSAGVVAERDLALVVATRFDDRDTDEVAVEQHLSPASARRARHRAETRLAAFYAGACAA